MCRLFFRSLVFVCLLSTVCVAQPPRLLEVQFSDGKIAGMPVHWGAVDAAVIDPSGYFHLFEQSQVESHKVLPIGFRPQSLPEARSRLQAELGPTFEIQIAGPYVIASPAGAGTQWKSRFLTLLAGYTRYFEVRGWAIRRPDFPLVVIVFPDRSSFRRYARTQVSSLPAQVVGSYFPKSNRCTLYQIPGQQGVNWSETEATIVHEAVHQLAYNTGGHERLFENPLWFVEGLATMFEIPAVYELGVQRAESRMRVHGPSIERLRPLIREPAKLEANLRSLISSDNLFEQDPQLAYALAWSLTFYLTEKHAAEYGRYMQLQNGRQFGAYTEQERRRDFDDAFQMTPAKLGLQMSRFFVGLRSS